MKLKSLTLLAAGAALLVAITGCGTPGSAGKPTASVSAKSGDGPYQLELAKAPTFAAGSTMEKLAKAGSIRIGTKYDQPLFGLLGTGDVPAGFDVAIGSLVASKLGIPFTKIKFSETVSANREPFLQNNQVDIVVATYTINDKRKQVVSFAGPYFLAGQAVLVLADNKTIKGPEDLAGKPVCSVEGSTPAANIVAKYTAKLVPTDVYSNCLDPLRNKQVVAMTTDNVILSGFVDRNKGEFKIVGKPFTEEPYGIGLAKDDTAFRAFINDVLEKSFTDGTWARLFAATAGKVLDTPQPPALTRY
ncbi:MAG: glutamate ABC transporter substrate-binding protein [Microbacteriaceae bacterium]|nr:glutamate ABC transporter substrate-binding protein [Microbacteriaceae bacterium]